MTEPYKNISESYDILFNTEWGTLWKIEREEFAIHFYRYNKEKQEFEYDGWNRTLTKKESIKDMYDRHLLEQQA